MSGCVGESLNKRDKLREIDHKLYVLRCAKQKALRELQEHEDEFATQIQSLKVRPDPECCCAVRSSTYSSDYGTIWYCAGCFCIIDLSKDID